MAQSRPNLIAPEFDHGRLAVSRAIEFFENAKQGFTEAGYTIPIPLTDRKIDLVKKQIAKK